MRKSLDAETKARMTNESSERMEKLLIALKLKPADLARKIGRSGESILRVLKRKNAISKDMAFLINDHYPRVNVDWLLFGKGDMMLTNVKFDECEKCREKDEIIETLKYTIENLKLVITEQRKSMEK